MRINGNICKNTLLLCLLARKFNSSHLLSELQLLQYNGVRSCWCLENTINVRPCLHPFLKNMFWIRQLLLSSLCKLYNICFVCAELCSIMFSIIYYTSYLQQSKSILIVHVDGVWPNCAAFHPYVSDCFTWHRCWITLSVVLPFIILSIDAKWFKKNAL